MKAITKHSLNILRRTFGYGVVVILSGAVTLTIYLLNQRDDLGRWHKVILEEEFTGEAEVPDFAAYLELEERLFEELENKIYAQTPPAGPTTVNRFQKGSLMDPTSMSTNWNRTFELKHENPKAGVLLLHGMSDSPYSLRHLGRAFHASGASVIGLRLPGHGTAPSGLVRSTWEDMAAATRLAARHLKEMIGDRPLYLVGYSNGGALAVLYAMESLVDSSLPKVDGLVLLSPAIGVTPAAGLAVWQGRLGRWFGFEKLAWNNISKEYDPFKYCSFAINAAHQTYRATVEIADRFEDEAVREALPNFPPVLAFQSSADATVSTPALISRLFDQLPKRENELVLFGLNRADLLSHLIARDPQQELSDLLSQSMNRFAVTILRNARADDGTYGREVVLHRRLPGQAESRMEASDLIWPENVFSLSHIALPFPESDPLYGNGKDGEIPTLGNQALRGERGTLVFQPGDMLRQRWNPFYDWMKEKCLTFMKLNDARD